MRHVKVQIAQSARLRVFDLSSDGTVGNWEARAWVCFESLARVGMNRGDVSEKIGWGFVSVQSWRGWREKGWHVISEHGFGGYAGPEA